LNHKIYKITSVNIKGKYTLELQFDDGAKKVIDFSPVLHGEMYSPLNDLALFSSVKIDSEVHHHCLVQMAPILTRRFCTIGKNMLMRFHGAYTNGNV